MMVGLTEQLLDKWGPVLEKAFAESIYEIRSAIVLREVTEAVAAGDLAGAIDAMHVDAAAWSAFVLAAEQAYTDAGTQGTAALPRLRDLSGHTLVMRFSARDPTAVNWLQSHSADLVGGLVGDQKSVVRTALAEGLRQGWSARRTALALVGRVDSTTGRRVGGVVGLDQRQLGWVSAARAELLSGDPERLRNYLSRKVRDHRFDSVVSGALRDARSLDADTTEKIVARYADRLMLQRGVLIARAETQTAVGRARQDAVTQQVVRGNISSASVTETWRSAGDNHVRFTHRVLNGRSVPYGGVFVSPSGARLAYPGDPSAPLAERAGCRCHLEYSVSGTDTSRIRATSTRVRADA